MIIVEDNTVFVVQLALKKTKCRVSSDSVKDFLLGHPSYPSLKAVCDALHKWGIEYYALKLTIEEILALEIPFITHFNQAGGQLAFVERIRNGNVTWQQRKGKKQTSNIEEFTKQISGAVIVIEPGQKAGEPGFRRKRQDKWIKTGLLPMAILTIILYAVYNFISNPGIHLNSAFLFLTLTKLVGITASLFLVLHELKIHTPIGDKLCGFSSKTDCGAVLTSNASRLFGDINWADAGIIYFTGTFLYLMGTTSIDGLGIQALLSVILLAYTLFSIYYQSVKLKKWCPFCLIVQLVLIAEFFISLPAFKNFSLQLLELGRLAFALMLPATIWVIFKMYLEKSYKSDQEHYSFLKLKREPELFRFLLKKDGYTEFAEITDSLIFGYPNAPVTITAFLSLYCTPCAQAFKKLKVLLENCPNIKLNAVFSVYTDDETQQIINALYYFRSTKGSNATLELIDSWYSLPKSAKKSSLNKEAIPEHYKVAQQVGNINQQLFEKYQIAGTPTIYVNGYEFPKQYEYSDLEYYIEDIKQLNLESKRQEACTQCN